MRIAPAITITEEQALQLQAWARGRSVEVLLAQRAQMILLAAAQQLSSNGARLKQQVDAGMKGLSHAQCHHEQHGPGEAQQRQLFGP